jgi:hypothetical protein
MAAFTAALYPGSFLRGLGVVGFLISQFLGC